MNSALDQTQSHEVLQYFADHLQPLSTTLTEMLSEHYSHQTERRGCGYTQSTRLLAEFVNKPRDAVDTADLKVFDQYPVRAVSNLLDQASAYQLNLSSWRNLDTNPAVSAFLAQAKEDTFSESLRKEVAFQQALRGVAERVELEESKLLCDLIEDIILPKSSAHLHIPDLQQIDEKPKVGSCPMAEKFFLKVAHDQLLRQGVINIFVDENNRPVLMEKLNMGDNHSCISLAPLMLNGVRLPAGSLFSTDYQENHYQDYPKNKQYKGNIIPIHDVKLWFLRFTTLAVTPKNRARAFTTHFKQQVQNGLLNPHITELNQILKVAQSQF